MAHMIGSRPLKGPWFNQCFLSLAMRFCTTLNLNKVQEEKKKKKGTFGPALWAPDWGLIGRNPYPQSAQKLISPSMEIRNITQKNRCNI